MNYVNKTMLTVAILALTMTQAYSANTTTPAATTTNTSNTTSNAAKNTEKTTTTLAANISDATPKTTPVSISPEERTKIETVVKEYLLQQPEVIIQAVQNYQQKQYQQAEETIKQTQKTVGTYAAPLFHQTANPVAGNPNGKVTVVEFFDYQCQHCADMAPIVAALIKANPDVRFVFKEFPIRGPASELAAKAALAANKQGKYLDFSHALLIKKEPITQELIDQTAKSVGLNVDQLKKDMNDKSIEQEIKENTTLAQNLKLFGTPAFFVGKTDAKNSDSINYVPGQLDQAQLQALIDKSK